jgi:hypothetical protein
MLNGTKESCWATENAGPVTERNTTFACSRAELLGHRADGLLVKLLD